MGAIGKLLSFFRREEAGALLDEAKVDLGGGHTKTVQHYAPPGYDAQPLAGDFPVLVEADGTGEMAAVGYHDTETERKAGPGETRIYARSGAGVAVAEIWTKDDGTVYVTSLVTGKPVIVKSDDVRLGDEQASRPVACVGDIVMIGALQAGPFAVVPIPAGVPIVGQIISGSVKAKGT